MPEMHPLLAGRWSPLCFDSSHDIAVGELASLIEAARWAPSADNCQPWRFVIGRRDDETHKRVVQCLSDAEQRWAWGASALIAAAYTADEHVTAPLYDLGQAVAHLGIQARALNLHTHQITGFDATRLHQELAAPHLVRVHAVVAVGRLGDPTALPADLRSREFRLRERRPVADLMLVGPL